MKKLVITQSLLLGFTIVLGFLTKFGVISGLNSVHGVVGFASAIIAVMTTVVAFRGKYNTLVKTLNVVTLLLVASAFVAGRLLSTAANYQLIYGVMFLSGILAFIISVVLIRKTKSHSTKK